MASDIFVRILRGMEACRQKSAQSARVSVDSETLLRLCLGFGKSLPNNVSSGFCLISRAHFEIEKTFENVCTTKGLPYSRGTSLKVQNYTGEQTCTKENSCHIKLQED